jgi:hypothetical protein
VNEEAMVTLADVGDDAGTGTTEEEAAGADGAAAVLMVGGIFESTLFEIAAGGLVLLAGRSIVLVFADSTASVEEVDASEPSVFASCTGGVNQVHSIISCCTNDGAVVFEDLTGNGESKSGFEEEVEVEGMD